ncbi:MAG: glycosyltransferase [Deltaproteobacteria bacterium]|nr:glycosyltransferase [Deltaproteobacteria bacterium]
MTKLAVLTTYNQHCGLAEYVQSLIQHFPNEDLLILAESVPSEQLTAKDSANVIRCWNRGMKDFTELEQIILRYSISVLHLNCHYRFFNKDAVVPFLKSLRNKGIRIILQLHTTYTTDPALQALVRNVDQVVVHTLENKVEAVANGADPQQIRVIDLGAPQVKPIDKATARNKLGIPQEQKVVVSYGFIQAHKGVKEIVQSIQALRVSVPNICLYIVGTALPNSQPDRVYYESIKSLVKEHGLEDKVKFVDRYVSNDEVVAYLCAADAVALYYLSFYHESSAVVAQALACGASIVTSSAPTFSRLHEEVFHVTAGYPLPLAIQLVLTNNVLNAELRRKALSWAERFSRENMAGQFLALYEELGGGKILTGAGKQRESMMIKNTELPKILMWNRSNAISQRGGDTVVMEETAKNLRLLGLEVEIDVECKKDPRDYDLVHLHNFATPEITKAHAEFCAQHGVPFVVTTMYEDLPIFYNQMNGLFRILEQYIKMGQPKERWPEFIAIMKQATPSGSWVNTYTAGQAAALIASGSREKETLLRDYPQAKYVDTYRLGCEVSEFMDDGSLFVKETGIKDFVLCVGRLETRKNQLMLIKALEESDLTLVFATGGFTYQPDYEAACRNFKRKGRTHFLGRLPADVLASAYSAARVHALPSWYELPGIVSMEAARRNTNLVVSDRGTVRDYFGDWAYYCAPDDAESILRAVNQAYSSQVKPELAASVADCTWLNAAKQVLKIYERALGKSFAEVLSEQKQFTGPMAVKAVVSEQKKETKETSEIKSKTMNAEQEKLCLQAENLLKSGQIADAEGMLQNLLQPDQASVRVLRALGVAKLQVNKFAEAKEYFERAFILNSGDARIIAGLGAALWGLGQHEEAYSHYLQSLALNPDHLPSIYYLMDASYSLGRLDPLREVLIRFVKRNPTNHQIKYCLAGCLYKLEQWKESGDLLSEILKVNPTNTEAGELLAMVKEKLLVEHEAQQQAIASMVENEILPQKPIDSRLAALIEAKERKDYPTVIAAADNLINDKSRLEAERVLAALLKAESYAASGEVSKSEEIFNSLRNSDSYRYRTLAGLGAIFASRGSWQEAQDCFRQSLQLNPSYDVALAGLGVCAESNSDPQLAWGYFIQALDKNTENLRALLGVVGIGYRLDRVIEIERYTKKYLELHPANVSILYAHAGSLYALNRYQEARVDLQKALIFDRNNSLVLELLEKIESNVM